MTSMNNLQALEALVRKFFERRNIQLFEGVRLERGIIANRLAAAGTLNSGQFLYEVKAAFVAGFEAFARGLIKDTFDLLNRSSTAMDSNVEAWTKSQLDPFFETAAKNLREDAAQGRVLRDELIAGVDGALTKSLAEIRRDLQIELDLALVTKAPAAAAASVVDEALLDQLVPLQNRRGLEQALGALSKQPEEPFCLVQFDLDHFKAVNDQHGHDVGNEALRSIAEAAIIVVKGKGQAFRLHGDEFVLLLPNHTLQEGVAVAERFRRKINDSPRTSQNLTLSVSVGLSLFPDHGDGFDALLKAADIAMYDAKKRGKNLLRYYGEVEPKIAVVVHEVEKKEPEPGGLSADERLKIRKDYFRSRVAYCPRDESMLEVDDITSLGQSTRSVMVSCPMCGLSEVC
jgi:diguanylate cyclase (GGDEF)-like protein